jgi:hypothetical protein
MWLSPNRFTNRRLWCRSACSAAARSPRRSSIALRYRSARALESNAGRSTNRPPIRFGLGTRLRRRGTRPSSMLRRRVALCGWMRRIDDFEKGSCWAHATATGVHPLGALDRMTTFVTQSRFTCRQRKPFHRKGRGARNATQVTSARCRNIEVEYLVRFAAT